MSIRDDLIPILDDIRRDVIDEAIGLRLDTVVVRRRVWSGPRRGVGSAVDTDTELDPRPKVHDPSPRARYAEPGRYDEGDQICDKISLTYTQAQLDGRPLAANEELYWLVNGTAFSVISVEEGYLGWRVHLRKMRERPT